MAIEEVTDADLAAVREEIWGGSPKSDQGPVASQAVEAVVKPAHPVAEDMERSAGIRPVADYLADSEPAGGGGSKTARPAQADISDAEPTEPRNKTEELRERIREVYVEEGYRRVDQVIDGLTELRSSLGGDSLYSDDINTWLVEENIEGYRGSTVRLYNLPNFLFNARVTPDQLTRLEDLLGANAVQVDEELHNILGHYVRENETPVVQANRLLSDDQLGDLGAPFISGTFHLQNEYHEFSTPQDEQWRDSLFADLDGKIKAREEDDKNAIVEMNRHLLQWQIEDMDRYLTADADRLAAFKEKGQPYLRDMIAKIRVLPPGEIGDDEWNRRADEGYRTTLEEDLPNYVLNARVQLNDDLVIQLLAHLAENEGDRFFDGLDKQLDLRKGNS